MKIILEIIEIILKQWLMPGGKPKSRKEYKELFNKYKEQNPPPQIKAENVKMFLERLGTKIFLYCIDTPVFPSMAIAQAALESGWNAEAKTLYGVKATGWKGKALTLDTLEDRGDGLKPEKQSFRVYDTVDDSIKDYIKLLCRAPWYKDVIKAKGVHDAVWGLQNDKRKKYKKYKYATDKNYEKKIMSVINTFYLRYYDQAKQWILNQ